MFTRITTVYESTPEIDQAERALKEQLRQLDEMYAKHRKPIIDRLADLQAMKIPKIIVGD